MTDQLPIQPGDREDPSGVDYLRAAFYNQYNVISLAGLTTLGLLLNPGIIYLTLAAELAYLVLVPSDERFRRQARADANRATLDRAMESDVDLLAKLPEADKRRYLELVAITEKVREVANTVDSTTRIMVDQDLAKLDYLLRTFVRMLAQLGALREHLATVNRGGIGRDIDRLTQEAEGAKPRVKVVKMANVEILRQRLARIERAIEDRELVEANIGTIEDTLKLIRDNVVSLNSPTGISDQIDGVVQNMKESERLMQSMSSVFDQQAVQDLATAQAANAPLEGVSAGGASASDAPPVLNITDDDDGGAGSRGRTREGEGRS